MHGIMDFLLFLMQRLVVRSSKAVTVRGELVEPLAIAPMPAFDKLRPNGFL